MKERWRRVRFDDERRCPEDPPPPFPLTLAATRRFGSYLAVGLSDLASLRGASAGSSRSHRGVATETFVRKLDSPPFLAGLCPDQRRDEVVKTLSFSGLDHRARRRRWPSKLSGPSHNYGRIRPPMHPAPALLIGRILPVFSLFAPCGAGASAPSVRGRNYEMDHLDVGRRSCASTRSISPTRPDEAVLPTPVP